MTRSKPDDTVYVLRPPGEDPRAILRVARLVLPEGPYGRAGQTARHARHRPSGVKVPPRTGRGRTAPGPRPPPASPSEPAEAGVLTVRRLRRSPAPQRLDERGHVTPVFGRQLVDAGDQEFPFLIARVLALGRDLVVVVQPVDSAAAARTAETGTSRPLASPSIVAGRGGRARLRVVASV